MAQKASYHSSLFLFTLCFFPSASPVGRAEEESKETLHLTACRYLKGGNPIRQGVNCNSGEGRRESGGI
jgi:hypothetical protein